METAALVAPVTALEFLRDEYLLTGEGPVLTVYRLQPRPEATASLSVLHHYRIHGIRPRPPAGDPRCSSAAETDGVKKDGWSSTTESNQYDLVVFGGKAVRLVRLSVELHRGDHLHLEAQGPLMELQDWALDVRWLSGGRRQLLCVALAHNSALLLDVHEGIALVQCSCEEGCLLYSALLLIDESWVDSVLVGGTVFNQLIIWRPGGREGEGSIAEHKAPVERRLLGHSGVIFSISYLEEKGLLASASDDRSVRVWGVGVLGGPGGKCGDLNPACLKVLYGHQARVFSVHLSPGKVFSAGEDGACLVWDWAGGGKVTRTLKGHRAGGVRALAVSEGTSDEGKQERWVATGGADGGVRLWRVEAAEEKEEQMGDAVTETLTDLQFSGQGMPKVVCVLGEEDENESWAQSKFVVCTDQGMVYQFCNGQWELIWQGTPDFQSYCVMEMVAIRVKSLAAKVNLCAVGNLRGEIQVFPISQPQSGILLRAGSGKIHSLIWIEGQEGARQVGYLLASGAEGLVHRWCVEVTLNEDLCLVLCVEPLPLFQLPPCAKRWLTAAVRLRHRSQGGLWVCGDRRGSLLLFQERSKREENKEIDEGEQRERGMIEDLPLQPLSCLFGVHGKQGVTSVCEYQGLLYSAGRDGCVRVFKVNPTPLKTYGENRGKVLEGLQLEVLRVQRACKGMEWLERVLILEAELPEHKEEEEDGEGCENHYEANHRIQEKLEGTDDEKAKECLRENEGSEARFAIAGFHAVHFVVWDPVRQEKLLAVPCGGGHRSWSLWPSHKPLWPGYGALVFIKQGTVLTSQPPREGLTGAGKAGKTGGLGLREGVHGRGIGCVCRLGRLGGIRNGIKTKSAGNRSGNEAKVQIEEVKETEGEEGHWEVVVTGGDDTSLTVLAVQPNSGAVRVLSVITDHISSVRTLAAVMRSEGSSSAVRIEKHGQHAQSLSALLVSAGGRAQMQCYRLLIGWDGQRGVPSCQVIQVAGHRLDEHWERKRNRHKMVKMDPETRYMSIAVVDQEADCVLLALACSDGAVRLFSVREEKGQIDLLWESFYHQRCVLSVATCSLEDGKGNSYKLLFSAATDGKIAVFDVSAASSLSNGSSSDAPTPPIPCLSIPAHQSGVNSLAVWAEKTGRREGGCLVTAASGGDDGQLTVSVVRVQFPEGEVEGSRGFSQSREKISEQQAGPQISAELPLHMPTEFDCQMAPSQARFQHRNQTAASLLEPPNQPQPHIQPQSYSQPCLPSVFSHQQTQPHSQLPPLHLRLHSQSRVPLAHAAPLTALKLLSPGLVASASPDQRVCLWRVCSTGISHNGALYSHVADAAGLAVWQEGRGEGETGGRDGIRGDGQWKVRFGVESETGSEAGRKVTEKSEGETDGTCRRPEGKTEAKKQGETAAEAEGEKQCETASETGDAVCKSGDGKVRMTGVKSRNQTGNDEAVVEVESAGSSETGSREASCDTKAGETDRTGWVLVCGQGLQLLRVRNTEMDGKMWTEEMRKGEKTKQRVKVTFQENQQSFP
ncbi:tRNA (34-2'-O)-methyltransferase regulator WDR6 [Myripristis murdjan]|uniref:tRNA (34-2'-O)-methyltransferase regulator WDR6 n=1 Tax=Myripristis murdjan TaxID=586833 RepID=A0A667WUW6_9TELE|nr:WD repeat-containing protein 6 [Myripristis murdjan]